MSKDKETKPGKAASSAVETVVMRGWDWQYARWLVILRKALLATGCFEKGVYPDPKAWWDYYKYTKLTPYQSAKKDTGVTPSGFYMEWNGRYPNA